MAHWYLDTRGSPELFGKDHRKWGRLQGWPLNKDGSPKKSISDREKVALGLVPGTTDILKMIGGGKVDGLMMWSARLGIKAGLKSSDMEGALSTYMKERDKPSATGSGIHDDLKNHFAPLYKKPISTFGEIDRDGVEPVSTESTRACQEVERWLRNAFPGYQISALEQPFIDGSYALCRNPYAGTVDMRLEPAGRTDPNDPSNRENNIFIDFKTTAKERAPYPTECSQLEAYSGWDEKKFIRSRTINMYIDQGTGALYNVHEWSKANREAGMEMFALAHALFYSMCDWKLEE